MKKVLSNVMKGTFLLLFLCSIVGCTKKDLYNPDTDPDPGKQPLPDPNEYFDFNMREDVNLYVDYDAPGFKTLIEVYDENPLVSDNSGREKKEGVEALFKIYTDDNGRYEGKMNIPTAIKNVYLYTSTWGLPGCVKVDVENGAVRLDMSGRNAASERAVARSYDFDFGKEVPYPIDAQSNLYSLCKWEQSGNLIPNECILETVNMIGQEKMQTFAERIQNFFTPNKQYQDNSEHIKGADVTNLHLKQEAKVNIVFVNKDAQYNNTFGYYYYKEGEKVNANTRKYIIFPNVDNKPNPHMVFDYIVPLRSGYKVKLQYFGENGDGPASDQFPAGYIIGWFIYANGFNFDPSPTAPRILTEDNLITTNDIKQRYVTLKDDKSGKLIIGVEDGGNKSYCDLLFYTEATPESAIEDPNRPSIPDPEIPPIQKPDANENKLGTLAFEDIWPTGGDYDMNDVVIEYERKVSFNTSNMVTKIEDTFKPVHNGATYTNAFAYQIDKSQFGTVNNLPNGTVVEKETSSIIVFTNNKTEIGKVYTIAREFDGKSLRKENINEYNPYIIVNYAEGEKDRKEVHLPKQKATDWADKSLIGDKDDAYYLKRDGSYPFAIDIPIWGFKVVTESKHIDDEYPKFKSWAKSFGKSDTDWYK